MGVGLSCSVPGLSSPCLSLPLSFEQCDFWDSQDYLDSVRAPQSLPPPPPPPPTGLLSPWNDPTANLSFSPGLQSGLKRWKILYYPLTTFLLSVLMLSYCF